MTGTKIAIILIIALVISVGVFIFIKYGLPEIKRKKLSEGVANYLQTKLKSKTTKEQIYEALKKANNEEIDLLIQWAKLLQNEEYLQVAAMVPKIDPILKKTGIAKLLLTP